ncbi:unnamed protein product [Diatraea saccharalis]|uniref:protein-tyrosine-phosphatase n=1 Tax=Diatraea saccharalis TaxID=40085 RepID=A0A9N9WMG9_9NEOP|nr:unnamed protein product [Diatraea saccharalis]
MGGWNSKRLTRANFIKYFEDFNSCKLICDEHKKIINTKTKKELCASLFAADNHQEGRTDSDHNLAVLSKEEGFSNYYNASYIDGFNRPNEYIVGKSPTSSTSSNFWQMIWDHQTEIIVLLNDPEDDGDYFYWSQEIQTSIQFGKLTIHTLKVLPHFSFQITLLLVIHEDGSALFVNHFM